MKWSPRFYGWAFEQWVTLYGSVMKDYSTVCNQNTKYWAITETVRHNWLMLLNHSLMSSVHLSAPTVRKCWHSNFYLSCFDIQQITNSSTKMVTNDIMTHSARLLQFIRHNHLWLPSEATPQKDHFKHAECRRESDHGTKAQFALEWRNTLCMRPYIHRNFVDTYTAQLNQPSISCWVCCCLSRW